MTNSLLDIQGLDAGYSQPVIHSVTLQLKPGEILGFIGANGSGKSTLMRAIVGVARCFSGHIRRPERGDLAYLAQQYPDNRETPVTGRDVFNLLASPLTDLPERIQQLLDLRMDHMSTGERQLIKAWGIIHTGARLVLLDEPTSSLDVDAKLLLASEISAISSDRAALIISHDKEFLRLACTRIEEFCY